MNQRYYVAILAESGWQRISRSVSSVRQAQLLRNGLSERHPKACVVAEVAGWHAWRCAPALSAS